VERRKNEERTKDVLVSILFMGSMLWMVVCGGCKTMGRGLPMPGRLSGQGEELKSINGKLYDYLQILLWVGMNNYDSCEDDQFEDYGPRNRKPGIGTGKLGNGRPGNKEVGKLALGGCLEIVGLPDDNERILANNMDGEGVSRLVKDAKALKTRKERLVGRLWKDTALFERRYARYESSHRTLRTLQVFGGLACLFVLGVGLIFFRPR
jgi:hypothetical protein